MLLKFNFLKIRELLNCKANQPMKKLILAFIYFVPFVITAQNAIQYADALTAKYEQDLLKATQLLKPPFLGTKTIVQKWKNY